MKNEKSENVLKFERQTQGTILTIVEIATVLAGLLLLIGIFLPICEIKLLNKTITIFDFTDESMIGFIMNAVIIFVSFGGKLLIKFFRNRALDEKQDKSSVSKIVLLIGGVSLFLTIILMAINLPIIAISSCYEISDSVLSAGAGTIMIYIGATLVALENVIIALFYYAIFNNKIKTENLVKIINTNTDKK